MFQIINRYINNGRKYRANKKDIDDVVDKFENDIWDEYDKYTADLESKGIGGVAPKKDFANFKRRRLKKHMETIISACISAADYNLWSA